MKVMHLIGGKETAGSKSHLLPLLIKLNDVIDVSLCVFEWGEIPEEAQAAGVKVFYLNQKGRYDVGVIKRLRQTVESESIDVLHTHGPRANLYGLFIRPLMTAKWVSTVHSDPQLDFMDRGWLGRTFSYLNVMAIKRVDYCFAISDRFFQKLRNYGVNAEKMRTIYNGISFDESQDIEQVEGPRNEPFTILNVSRLHPVKGHAWLFKAFRLVKDRTDRELRLVLVGDGDMRSALVRLAKKWGIDKEVAFMGHQSDVTPFYEQADLYVQSSLSESFPIVLLEAAKAKRPVVSTDVGDVSELIKSDKYGWVVPVKDERALAHAMEAALTISEGDLEAKALALHERASQHFSLNRLVQVIVNGYQLVLKRPGVASVPKDRSLQ